MGSLRFVVDAAVALSDPGSVVDPDVVAIVLLVPT